MLNGDKLRKLREQKGYSQEYIASRLNISQSAYSKIEKGETDLSLKRIDQLASLFEKTTPVFVGLLLDKDSKSNIPEGNLHLKEKVKDLKEEVGFLRGLLSKISGLSIN